MKPSLLSLLGLTFLGIKLDINPKFEGKADTFDFDGAMLHWKVRHGKRDDKKGWWVGVEFATQEGDEKPCPYLIDMKAVALVEVSEHVPAEEQEKFVYENGASLVYGAIREMVSTISARSAYGSLMLPTASFFGSFEERAGKEAMEEDGLAVGY